MKKILLITTYQNTKHERLEKYWFKNPEVSDLKIDIVNYKNAELYFGRNVEESFCKFGDIDLRDYDLIYFKNVDKARTIFMAIDLFARLIGKSVVNNFVGRASKSKIYQAAICMEVGILHPKTYFSKTIEPKKVFKLFGKKNVVMKSVNGMKGHDNFVVKSEKEIQKIIELDDKKEFIFQEFIPNDFDYRLLVIKGRVRSVGKRERRPESKDHRNNVYLGARESFVGVNDVSDEMKENSELAVRKINYMISGVDYIICKETGKEFLIEINESPGITLKSDESKALFKFLSKF